MNLFPNPTYNGYFKKGGTTFAPIAGTVLETAYSKPLAQAKLTEDNLMQGMPVKLTNGGGAINNGDGNTGLAPNVFTASKTTDAVHGFIVNSPNDILLEGDMFPRYLKNQILRVAILGSGTTVYLAANNNCGGIATNTVLKWNNTTQELDINGDIDLPGVKIAGQVVDGIRPSYNARDNKGESKPGLVLKVIL